MFKAFMLRSEQLLLDVVVVDDGSDEDYLEELRQFSHLIIISWSNNTDMRDIRDNRMSASRRFAAREALTRFPDKKYFLYSVPEKSDLIEEKKLSHIVTQMKVWRWVAAVIGRNSLTDLPPFQQLTEARGNYRLSQLLAWDRSLMKTSLGKELPIYDFFFWVWVFSRSGLEKYYFSYLWNKWSEDSIPLMQAIRAQEKVSQILIDFQYPSEQMQFEKQWVPKTYERKRASQFRSIVTQARRVIR